jgi:zinc protease
MMLRALILPVALATGSFAAGPVGQPAPEGPPRAVADTLTTEFDVNGLKVILRRNPSNDVVAASLYFLGGTQQLTKETQGIESLVLTLSERGTQRYPGAAMRQKTASLGTNIGVGASKDWTAFSMRAIRPAFDSSWALFTDRVLRPTLAPAELDLIRAQLLAAFRSQGNDPDHAVEELADSIEFAGHPYGLSPGGTESSIRALTAAQLREYRQASFVTTRMMLVVVGNIDRAKLEPMVRTTLGTLPRGTFAWKPPPPIVDQTRALAIKEARIPTNYLIGYYAGPAASHADYPALRIASAVIAGRFFTEIRSKRNLSYAPDAPFLERAFATGGVYVSTVDPNATLTIMRNEIARLQRELIESDGLDRLVSQFLTDYFLKNETNTDQANFLARAAIYQGDYRRADEFVSDLRRVRPEDVRRVARLYMKNFRFAYVGDPSKLDRGLLELF